MVTAGAKSGHWFADGARMKLKDLITFWVTMIFCVSSCTILFFAALGSMLGWDFNMAALGF